MTFRSPLAAAMAACLAAAPVAALSAQDHDHHHAGGAHAPAIGTVRFENGGPAAAQAALGRGLAYLHSFHYHEAQAAFREAAAADPRWPLPVWLEALAYSRVVWGFEELAQSRAALARLGGTPAERVALARTADERGLGEAVEAFFGEGTLKARVDAFAGKLRAWSTAAPASTEAAAFTSLGLMWAGFEAPRAQQNALWEESAEFAGRVFKAHPDHPGGAHYLIHALDRPSAAPRALAAARAYDRIAPDADHALHMPSHIYYQVGDWAAMARANERAWAAGRARGEPSAHSLEWLQYAYLQQGRWQAARAIIDSARVAWAGRRHDPVNDPDGAHVLAAVTYRYANETGRWEAWDRSLEADGARADELTSPSGPLSDRATGMGYNRALRTALAALSARGDTTLASALAGRMRARAATGGEGGLAARVAAQLDAALAQARGHGAEHLALRAKAAELAGSAGPSIPPAIPALELHAAALLAAGQHADAATRYRETLVQYPKRSSALLGLARALDAAGDRKGAAEARAQLRAVWGRADADVRALADAPRLSRK